MWMCILSKACLRREGWTQIELYLGMSHSSKRSKVPKVTEMAEFRQSFSIRWQVLLMLICRSICKYGRARGLSKIAEIPENTVRCTFSALSQLAELPTDLRCCSVSCETCLYRRRSVGRETPLARFTKGWEALRTLAHLYVERRWGGRRP